MKKILISILIFTFINIGFAETFTSYVSQIKREARERGFSEKVINEAFDNVQLLQRANYHRTHQSQVINPFFKYLKISVTPKRIAVGKEKLQQYKILLNAISEKYKVPPQYIVALWGLETNYGKVTGNFPEFSTLATLAYQSRRPKLFKNEIFAALTMLQEKKTTIDKMRGSWAGAMGQCQFMPTAYLLFAVAHDHQGPADIWNSESDVFASTAHYLKKEGWDSRYGLLFPVKLNKKIPHRFIGLGVRELTRVWMEKGVVAIDKIDLLKQGGKYSLLLPAGASGPAYLVNWNNFRVIMRWNASTFYAISVGELANKMENES